MNLPFVRLREVSSASDVEPILRPVADYRTGCSPGPSCIAERIETCRKLDSAAKQSLVRGIQPFTQQQLRENPSVAFIIGVQVVWPHG